MIGCNQTEATGLDLVDLRAKGDSTDESAVRFGSEDYTTGIGFGS